MFTVPTLQDALAEHVPYMRRVAFRLTRDFDSVGDYAHEAYLACLDRISMFDASKGTFRQWIAQTTVWTVRTIRKSESRRNGKLDRSNAVLKALIAADSGRCREIREAWQKLSPAYQRTIRKAFAKTLPTDGASRKRLCKARQKLMELIG